MIPKCVILTNSRQIEKLNRFRDFIDRIVSSKKLLLAISDEKLLIASEEDVSCASLFLWEIYPTGLGDVIHVKFMEHVCSLGINDDGEVSPDDWI